MRKKRTLVLTCAIILLCMCLVVGGTYSLLTESFKAHSHLVAGTLDVKLSRLNLTYTKLDEDGILRVYTVDDTKGEGATEEGKDFSGASDENVFGIDEQVLMVPGSYYAATMRLANKGNVAFDYTVQVNLLNSSLTAQDLAFAEQLDVTVYEYDAASEGGKGTVLCAKPLSELINEDPANNITGTMHKACEVRFVVSVAFRDYPNEGENNYDEDFDNNNAMKGQVKFDLIVTATQRTEAVTNGAETDANTTTTP